MKGALIFRNVMLRDFYPSRNFSIIDRVQGRKTHQFYNFFNENKIKKKIE